MRFSRLLFAIGSVGLFTAPVTALATGGDGWSTMAHDARRTARSNSTGAIGSAPEVAWKRSMGGALAETQVVTYDVDGDGDREVILVSAGKVSARRADDTQVWASPDIGALRVTGVYDLDGQGGAEVVAIGSSPPGLTVLSASTGSKLWFVPTNSTAIDAFAIPAGSGHRLFLARQLGPLTAYGFSGGILDPATNQLWEQAASPWSVDMAAGDLDGDGTLDLLRGDDRGFTAMDAATGAVKCSAPNLISGVTAPVYFPALSVTDVTGDGRAEAILYDYSYYYSEDAGVFVVSCAGSGPVLTPQVLWQQQWVTDTTPGPGNNVNDKQIRYLADGVANLDGQVPLEMVYSLWDAQASTWTTYVRNAATGAVVATQAGQVLEAVADLDADGKAEVLLRDSNGIGTLPKPFFSTLRLYDLDAGTFADKGWMLPGCRTATVAGRRTAMVTSGAGTIAARQDTNVNDPAEEVYVFAKSTGMFGTTDPRPGKLLTVHGSDGLVLHEYDFANHISGDVLMLTGGVANPAAQAESLVMLTDGGLRVLDRDLVETSKLLPGNHARLPAVASLDGVKNLIFSVTSADFLVALDGTQLSGGLPAAAWTIFDAIQPEARGYVNAPGLVVPSGSGAASRLVARVHSSANYEEHALAALQANGTPAWTMDIGTGRQVAGFDNFELLDDLDGDGEREFFLTELDAVSEQQMVIRKGGGGGVLVQRPTAGLFPPNGVYLQGHAAADINGDGKLDIISALHGSWFIGMDVSKAGTGDPLMGFVQIFRTNNGPNGQAMVGQLDADPEIDLVRANSQNAFGPYERRDLAGNVEASYLGPQPQVASTDANTAALVTRPGMPGSHDFVWAGMAGDALGAVARLDGQTMTEAWFEYLAGGMVYPKVAMPADRAALSSPIAVDLDGDGADEIVVGSNDGYLYALASLDGSLKWSLPLGAPVVHTLAADIDKDDKIELLVSLADGMLVALDATGAYDSDDVTPEPQPDGGTTTGTSGNGGMGGMTGSSAVATSTGSGGTGGHASASGTAAGGNGSAPAAEGGCGCAVPDARLNANANAAMLAWLALAWLRMRHAHRRRRS